MLATPDWQHTLSWLTTSQNTFTDNVDMAWDGRLGDAVRRGAATYTGRAKIFSVLDTLGITCAVEFEYINLGISDFFRISPRHRVVVFNGFVVVTTRGLRYLLAS